jgi:3-oxoacyl-[acyl-carrier protein] reductase
LKLTGKVAIITGAGRGIGKAISSAYAREQATLVLVSRTLSELKETAEQISRMGNQVLPLKADVSSASDVNDVVETSLEHFNKIDVLVNNAAIVGPIGPLQENDVADWIKTVDVNLVGAFLCCKAVLPTMIRQGAGKIINLSGGGVTGPRARFSAYAASKSAVIGLTSTLAEELKPFNIQVNAISPGAIFSRLHEQVLTAGVSAGEKELQVSSRLKQEEGSMELPANLAVFLASHESDGLTGRLISAVWDDWQHLDQEKIKRIMANDVYTLHRIDEMMYYSKKNS